MVCNDGDDSSFDLGWKMPCTKVAPLLAKKKNRNEHSMFDIDLLHLSKLQAVKTHVLI